MSSTIFKTPFGFSEKDSFQVLYDKATYICISGLTFHNLGLYLAFCVITLWTRLSNFLEFSSVTTKCLSPVEASLSSPPLPLFSMLMLIVRLMLFTVT